jgi:hypothetical protein
MTKLSFVVLFVAIALVGFLGMEEINSLKADIENLKHLNDSHSTVGTHHMHLGRPSLEGHTHDQKHDHSYEYAEYSHKHSQQSHSHPTRSHDHDEVEDMEIDVNYMKSQLIEIQYFVDTHRNVKHHRH